MILHMGYIVRYTYHIFVRRRSQLSATAAKEEERCSESELHPYHVLTEAGMCTAAPSRERCSCVLDLFCGLVLHVTREMAVGIEPGGASLAWYLNRLIAHLLVWVWPRRWISMERVGLCRTGDTFGDVVSSELGATWRRHSW